MSSESNTEEVGAYTQSQALQDIIAWSVDRPKWQRDALRQLVTGANIDNIDIDRLEELCLENRDDAEFLNETDVMQPGTGGDAVTLSKLKIVQGVNALADEQQMEFSKKGVTIVYGDNGSGKSGYCRVLKHACRTRDRKFEIHPNIEEADEISQSSKIEYQIGTESRNIDWSPDLKQDPLLAQVSIFDSKSASTHVEMENNVAYTPFPMRVLERLGDLCDKLKDRIEEKIQKIKQETPSVISNHELTHDTKSGEFVNKLTEKSDLKELASLCDLKEEDRQDLDKLRKILSEDTEKFIDLLKSQTKRIKDVSVLVQSLTNSLSDESIAELKKLVKTQSEAQEASELASKKLFEASPLPEIGSEIWSKLWEAARDFSEGVAYPTKQFPKFNTEEDLCVLCQQPLGNDAMKRFKTFEEFVKSTTKKKEQKASKDLDDRKKQLEETIFTSKSLDNAKFLLEYELSRPDIFAKLENWVRLANDNLTALLQQQYPALENNINHPKDDLDSLSQELNYQITQAESVRNPEGRAKLEFERKELEDQFSLAKIRKYIEDQIQCLKQINAIKSKLKTTERRPITNKNKELSESLVTFALRKRFAREIEKLNLKTIFPMELKKTRDIKSQSFFQIKFVGYPDWPIGEILSEGEHRCVALATFLAELVTSKDKSGIVFDDPMSSLDHIYRKQFAKRLVEEAQHRQVVIFTHDLGFLFEVNREVKDKEVPISYQHVERRNKKTGYITSGLPFKAKSASDRVETLHNELKNFKDELNTATGTKYEMLTAGFIVKLRSTWEQVIADIIHPVLSRFDSRITTRELHQLLDVKEEDVKRIKSAFRRLSEHLHNNPGALNPVQVSYKKLLEEREDICDFIGERNKRNNRLKSENK